MPSKDLSKTYIIYYIHIAKKWKITVQNEAFK